MGAVGWIILGGSHESPATAGDPELEELIRRFAVRLSRGECCTLWLGDVPVDVSRAIEGVESISATNLEQRIAALRRQHPVWQAPMVNVLLCAPLRFHAETWWASGVCGNKVRLFDALALIQRLLAGTGSRDVLVPGVRSWNAGPSAAPVDVPDDDTLADWQAALRTRNVECRCRLVWTSDSSSSRSGVLDDDASEMAADSPDALRALLLPRPTDEEWGRDLKGAWLWAAPGDHDRWAQRLAAYLKACGIATQIPGAEPSPPADPILHCVLHDAALDQLARRKSLGACCSPGSRLVLLDRFLKSGDDKLEHGRQCPPTKRGPWRALDQALWIADEILPHGNSLRAVEFETIRSRISEACDELRQANPDRWEDAVGPELAWLAEPSSRSDDAWLELGRNELRKFLSELLSLLGSTPALCVDTSDDGHQTRPGLARLIAFWQALRSQDDSEGKVPRPPQTKVRRTHDADFDWPKDETVFVTPPELRLETPEPITGAAAVPPRSHAIWVHVHTKKPGAELQKLLKAAEAEGTVVIRCEARANGNGNPDQRGHASAYEPRAVIQKARDACFAAWRAQRLFVSYSVADADRVAAIGAALEQKGVRCTIDGRVAHRSRLAAQVDDNVEQHQAVLLAHSEASRASDWVRAELRAALTRSGRRPPIISIDLDGSWDDTRDEYDFRDRAVALPQRGAIRFSSEPTAPQFEQDVDELMGALRAAGVRPGSCRESAVRVTPAAPAPPSHRIFISHTAKPRNRGLIERLLALCTEQQLEHWEYDRDSEIGKDWKSTLDFELQRVTHAVVLITRGFEQSPFGQLEVRTLAARRPNVVILPFLLDGREHPHVDLRDLQHRKLKSRQRHKAKRSDELARLILNEVTAALRRTPPQ